MEYTYLRMPCYTLNLTSSQSLCVFLFTGTQKAEENGEDYDRVKLLDKTADELERMEKKRKKKNPDEGFSGLDHI